MIVNSTIRKILTEASLDIESGVLRATMSGSYLKEPMVGFRARIFGDDTMVIQFILLPEMGQVGGLPLCGFTLDGWVMYNMWVALEVEKYAKTVVLAVLVRVMYQTALRILNAHGWLALAHRNPDIYLFWMLTEFAVEFDQMVDGDVFAWITEE